MFCRLAIFTFLLLTCDSRWSGGRGSSYRPSSSGSWSTPSRPSRPQTSSSSSYGWKAPRPSSSGPAPLPPAVTNMAKTGPPSGWQTPQKTSQNSGGTVLPPGVSNGWQSQRKTSGAPSLPSGATATKTGSAGWQTPQRSNQGTAAPPKAHPTSAPSNGWHSQPAPPTGANRPNGATNYGWKAPNQNAVTQRPQSFPQAVNKVQQTAARPNTYNTGTINSGKKYEKGYSKGYDQGYQRGVQQATKVNPAYYPQQSSFGYPGQGINAGYGSPTYGGMSVFGTPNNYGYPVSSAYGYQTYGTGNHDFRNGLLLGVAGGYLLNSALHPSRHTSLFDSTRYSGGVHNPWGYNAAGYGSGYEYKRTETTTNTNIVNNYYFDSPKKDKEGMPENWIQCVAYDPMADATYTNPNCSCTVTTEKDNTTNTSVANHSCDTIWGHKVEQKTPIVDVEIFDAERAANKTGDPEKLREISDAMRRMEAFKELEKIVHMGNFSI